MNYFTLRFLTPEKEQIFKAKYLSVEDTAGSLGIYPKHIDYITPLSRSLGYFIDEADNKIYIAYDYGLLKISNNNVSVISRTILTGTNLQQLKEELEKKVQKTTIFEKQLRENIKTLERMIMKEIIEIERG
ncbi:hypothetical protein JCM14244_13620 [Venenivibrio stagnispumantis]|uniref:F-type H+-transporting ATPase subunit epsilon n=1 Tax=Venenivibrio stagnispumantis TaxID=407998 RepID=A0AA46ADT0_9AQUI|nr:hypothetical protein [Venenivibrio stagnispumantis]MCW4573142.1 hypothetical protein [Venenivibrio stagnispumantis]SMP08554.1 F-type H+-transporting ATPase subunit epsilon [Venenivibrio stagnispumantis]